MDLLNSTSQSFDFAEIFTTAIKIPGVKVNRDKFLAERFPNKKYALQDIINFGPVSADISKEELSKIANGLIIERTTESSIVSFLAGLPGGWAMAGTIPADIAQFFAVTLRLAQELGYLYGAEDFWNNGELDSEKAKNKLLVYCGVMFGVAGAEAGLHILSSQLAKTTLEKLPQKALTKTWWYPILKKIGKAIGIKITKEKVANALAKLIPVFGGVLSGILNFTSLKPMANKLKTELEKTAYNYSETDLERDIKILENI
ncbi:MAG: bacteriochlorophyll 4-vinyl reductase [Ruminococcaceae bacterium]|nr:bacteriochlorophyll 4-vinyl reductase [Oscillospiraceae bacterium]